MKGAGGTPGGVATFLIGLVMTCGGFYLLLNAICLLYTSPSPRDATLSRMPSSA